MLNSMHVDLQHELCFTSLIQVQTYRIMDTNITEKECWEVWES